MPRVAPRRSGAVRGLKMVRTADPTGFTDLRTVVLFYNKYNSRAPARQIDPETGAPWAPPEVDGTLSMDDLTHGPALGDRRIDALVAFMETLTDRRYEHLLDQAQ